MDGWRQGGRKGGRGAGGRDGGRGADGKAGMQGVRQEEREGVRKGLGGKETVWEGEQRLLAGRKGGRKRVKESALVVRRVIAGQRLCAA